MSGQWLRILYYLVIAFVIGTAAQILTGYRRRPLLTTLALGFIGVIAGDLIADRLHLPHLISVFDISIVWSTLGAVIFIVAFQALQEKRR